MHDTGDPGPKFRISNTIAPRELKITRMAMFILNLLINNYIFKGGGGGGGLYQDFLEIDFLVVSDREE